MTRIKVRKKIFNNENTKPTQKLSKNDNVI